MDRLIARPTLTNLIEKVSLKHGFKRYKIANVTTNDKGEGFLGEIFMVHVVDEANGQTLDLIIKSAFADDTIRQVVPVHSSFENETLFYLEINREFGKLQEQLGVQLLPKCYFASAHYEVLGLENLKMRGFEIYPRTEAMDDDHVRIVMKTYGRFHAQSFLLQDQQPEVYKTLANKLHNVYEELMEHEIFRTTLVGTMELIYNLLVPAQDDDLKTKFEKYCGKSGQELYREAYTKESKFAAILHGDCWSNNMMFKYEDNKRKPVDIRLLDFQLSKLGSPVCDLSYYLYSGGSKQIYDRLDQYLAIYRDEMCTCIRKWGGNPQKLFTPEELKQEWREFSKFGLMMGMMVLKTKLVARGDLRDFTDEEVGQDMNMFLNLTYNEELYALRAREVLTHMLEIGAL